MHPRYLALRNEQADRRIKEAARKLAQGTDLDPMIERMETAHDPDTQVKALLRREALADLIEAVAQDPKTEVTVRRGRPPLSTVR